MDEQALRALVEGVQDGSVPADEALARLRRLPFADLGYARVDHHRALRQGQPEVVYAPGKTPDQCAGIVAELRGADSGPILVTRAEPAQAAAIRRAHPDAVQTRGQPLTLVLDPAPDRPEQIAVVTAGTADGPVADECAATLAASGLTPIRLSDVGVAGLHRLLDGLDELTEAQAVVVVAGMEGALASVVGGLVGGPVVAVPTSVGYGSSFEGVTALLAMLSSCASGVTVVGIDNGFGAAAAVLRLLARRPDLTDRPAADPLGAISIGDGEGVAGD